jgi:hypothetical protein
MTLKHPLGVQLYSGRKFPPVEAQLGTIARDTVFTNVETVAPFYDDAEATKRLLNDRGLSARSGHFALAMLEHEGERAVAIARRLGIEIVVAPYLAPAEGVGCAMNCVPVDRATPPQQPERVHPFASRRITSA